MDKKLPAVFSEFEGSEDELIPILQKVHAVGLLYWLVYVKGIETK